MVLARLYDLGHGSDYLLHTIMMPLSLHVAFLQSTLGASGFCFHLPFLLDLHIASLIL